MEGVIKGKVNSTEVMHLISTTTLVLHTRLERLAFSFRRRLPKRIAILTRSQIRLKRSLPQ